MAEVIIYDTLLLVFQFLIDHEGNPKLMHGTEITFRCLDQIWIVRLSF